MRTFFIKGFSKVFGTCAAFLKRYAYLILAFSVLLFLFGHLPRYFGFWNPRIAWYIHILTLHFSILFSAILVYSKNREKYLYFFLIFIIIKTLFCFADTMLSFHRIHIHKKILLLQYPFLGFLALKIYCSYKGIKK
jgi:hypothetical protein